jgi:hypothetical protein
VTCAICTYSEAHGHVPTGVVWHCDHCHVTGHGTSELHCVVCHRTFGSETVFTAHQTDRGCRDPFDLKKKDGTRRFRVIERSGKLVWVRTDAFSPSETADGPRDPKRRSVACERRYVHVSSKAS